MTDKTHNARDAAVLRECVSKLMEYFDNVQIFVNRDKPLINRIQKAADGDGNMFARYGQVKQWVIEEEAECANGSSYDCRDVEDEEEDKD